MYVLLNILKCTGNSIYSFFENHPYIIFKSRTSFIYAMTQSIIYSVHKA